MEQVAKRTRGRPKGAKNKNRIISGATVEQYCIVHNHNPTQFLIEIAQGKQLPHFTPTQDDIFRANCKLHDSIHGSKSIGKDELAGAGTDTQYEIVFIEPDSDALPGTADAGGVTQAV